MAGAMLARWLECGLQPALVHVVRPSGAAVAPGVRVTRAMPGTIALDTLVMLGHKPQQLAAVAAALREALAGSPVLSLLAGVPLADLRAALPAAGALVRCMPNLPVRLGAGVCLMHGEDGLAGEMDRLHAPLGLVEWLADERRFDAATALSGCGPAFLYRFIDALAGAGEALGLPAEQAARLALATVAGAAASAGSSGQSPAAMADAVASPGGMTRAGLDRLDRPDGMRALLTETLAAARDRGAALATLAKG